MKRERGRWWWSLWWWKKRCTACPDAGKIIHAISCFIRVFSIRVIQIICSLWASFVSPCGYSPLFHLHSSSSHSLSLSWSSISVFVSLFFHFFSYLSIHFVFSLLSCSLSAPSLLPPAPSYALSVEICSPFISMGNNKKNSSSWPLKSSALNAWRHLKCTSIALLALREQKTLTPQNLQIKN